MGQSQISSSERPNNKFFSTYHTKNIDHKDYSSYRGIKSSTKSSKETNESSYKTIPDSKRETKTLVEYTFSWKDGGGEDIYVTGSFSNWKSWFKLEKVGDFFQVKILLSKEKQYFKFIIDKEWKHSSFYDIEVDDKGIINNVIDLSISSASSFSGKDTPQEVKKPPKGKQNQTVLSDSYSVIIPNRANLNSEAPNIPCSYESKFNLNMNKSVNRISDFQFLAGNISNTYGFLKFYTNGGCGSKPIHLPPHVNL